MDSDSQSRHSAAVSKRAAQEYHSLKLGGNLARHLLSAAQEGNRWAALSLFQQCAEAISDKCEIPSPVAEWLAKVLKALSDGGSIEEAAKIPKRAKGQRKEADAVRERYRRYLIAQEYGVRTLYGERMKQIAAWREVGELFGVADDTVKAAWRDHGKEVTRILELSVNDLGTLMRIPIPPDLLPKRTL